MVYLSRDSVHKYERGVAIDQSIFSPEFIDGLKFSGVPNHILALKVTIRFQLPWSSIGSNMNVYCKLEDACLIVFDIELSYWKANLLFDGGVWDLTYQNVLEWQVLKLSLALSQKMALDVLLPHRRLWVQVFKALSWMLDIGLTKNILSTLAHATNLG
ncbi:hypothetical protein Tco_1163217 [Tanacetum coccineum]